MLQQMIWLLMFVFIQMTCLAQNNIKLDSVYCPECQSINRINFYYLSWDYNPVTIRDEESIRNNREGSTHFFSISERDSINFVLWDYFNCSNRNYNVKEEQAVVMIMELIMDSEVRTVLISPYFAMHDIYGQNYRNLEFIWTMLEFVPNTNTRIEKK